MIPYGLILRGQQSDSKTYALWFNLNETSCRDDNIISDGGAISCPSEQYPTGVELGLDTFMASDSYSIMPSATCKRPSGTSLETECTPLKAHERHIDLGGARTLQLPQSCTALGTTSTEMVINEHRWTISCVLWKHVVCVSTTTSSPKLLRERRFSASSNMFETKCANTKKVTFSHATVCHNSGGDNTTRPCHRYRSGQLKKLVKCTNGYGERCDSNHTVVDGWDTNWSSNMLNTSAANVLAEFERVAESSHVCNTVAMLQ